MARVQYVISRKFHTQISAFSFPVNGKSFTIKVCQIVAPIFFKIYFVGGFFFIWPNCVLEAGCLAAWLLSQQHLALPQLLNHHHFSRRQRTYYTLEVLRGQLVTIEFSAAPAHIDIMYISIRRLCQSPIQYAVLV